MLCIQPCYHRLSQFMQPFQSDTQRQNLYEQHGWAVHFFSSSPFFKMNEKISFNLLKSLNVCFFPDLGAICYGG